MHIQVLGSAAGGGYPQWNCNCETCQGIRRKTIAARARTQSSIAVSKDKIHWLLLNASPDIGTQLRDNPILQPGRARRDTGITAVMLMDSQIDHTTGLLSLREHHKALPLYSTRMVHDDLTQQFPLITLLGHYCGIDWHEITLDECWFTVPEIHGLEFKSVAIDSKAPPYSPHRHDPHTGDNIAVLIRDIESDKTLFYAPGLGGMGESTRQRMREADCLLVDGTTWTNDEMQRRGVGNKLASDMGHLPQTGEHGMMEELDSLSCRKILIHINNTNPILNENGNERQQLAERGIEVAFDGMHITL